MIRLRPPALIAVFLSAAALAHGQATGRTGAASWLENLSVSATSAATWVENISRTSHEPTRKDATTYEFGLAAEQHRQLSANWLLTLGAAADYTAVPEFDLSSRLKLGPRVALQRKFGLGPMAPVLQFDAAYSYQATRLAPERGWTAEAGLRVSKRLLPELKVAANARWLEHYAESATFDIQQRSLGAEASWDITDRWRLTGTASWLQGRVVANAAWAVYGPALGGAFGPAIQSYYSSIPFEVTNTYGAGWVAYNVEARVNLWSLALAYALTEQATLELRTDRAYVINHVGVRYPTESWGLGLNYRF